MINDIVNIIKSQIEGLAFVDKIAGLVVPVTVKTGNGETVTDSVFPIACDVSQADCVQNGRYKDLIPDSSKKSVIYFEDTGGVSFDGIAGRRLEYTASFRLVAWLNIKELGYNDCSVTGAIVNDIIKNVPFRPFNSGIFLNTRIQISGQEQKSPSIFGAYTYNTDTQFLLYPFDYFALNFSVTFQIDQDCLQTFTINTPDECNTH